jgi:predicted small secreted protein
MYTLGSVISILARSKFATAMGLRVHTALFSLAVVVCMISAGCGTSSGAGDGVQNPVDKYTPSVPPGANTARFGEPFEVSGVDDDGNEVSASVTIGPPQFDMSLPAPDGTNVRPSAGYFVSFKVEIVARTNATGLDAGQWTVGSLPANAGSIAENSVGRKLPQLPSPTDISIGQKFSGYVTMDVPTRHGYIEPEPWMATEPDPRRIYF